eukprot:gene19902-64143_t
MAAELLRAAGALRRGGGCVTWSPAPHTATAAAVGSGDGELMPVYVRCGGAVRCLDVVPTATVADITDEVRAAGQGDGPVTLSMHGRALSRDDTLADAGVSAQSVREAGMLGRGSFAFVFHMDRRKEERERGVTIHGSKREFCTARAPRLQAGVLHRQGATAPSGSSAPPGRHGSKREFCTARARYTLIDAPPGRDTR